MDGRKSVLGTIAIIQIIMETMIRNTQLTPCPIFNFTMISTGNTTTTSTIGRNVSYVTERIRNVGTVYQGKVKGDGYAHVSTLKSTNGFPGRTEN